MMLGAALILGSSLQAAGCESAVLTLLGAYDGPNPDQANISAERVIVRFASQPAESGAQHFYVDRLRLLETRPHDINRVVELVPGDVQSEVSRLGLEVGDTITISTRYLIDHEAGDLGKYVPDWPFDRYGEYPIGFHTLTAVERVNP
jgi:hypothetical protein